MHHHYQDLISIFNATFFLEYNTRLELGEDEPIYIPADDVNVHHRIILLVDFMHQLFMK